MRLIFIPGFGEEAPIFDQLLPALPGPKVLVDNWALVGDYPRPALTAAAYARELAERFGIGEEDVVIGHSMGGWIGLHLKQQTGCGLVQIASWTDPAKVVRPIKSRRMVYWLAKKGMYLNRLVLGVLVWRYYRNSPSRPVFSQVFMRLCRGNRDTVVNELRMILSPLPAPPGVQPDLRIHARADSLVRFPDEACCEVPGDHFTLCTHPDRVLAPILALLQERRQGRRRAQG
ncbi:alpha/beta fold hydrolase [Cesiribacter andamanensis]|uniref:Alpha/beta hydrolase family protein n=1 Tax=Cesiribacter andamanensis AMV16 TaxID=1279009 RepID=M7N1A2_9BACT|nr:alpha/beta hydrolase [Cesiribacter andamanensis]EMR02458.1 Alpha/beta hydrolase family protein [Cesiribacter andamanensis AMV16]